MADEPFSGKSGSKKRFVISDGYPYVLFGGSGSGIEPDDVFTLESSDGSYSRSVPFKEADQYDGYSVLWFPLPPESLRYSLKVATVRILPDGSTIKLEYSIFQDAILTLRNKQQPSPDTKASLR